MNQLSPVYKDVMYAIVYETGNMTEFSDEYYTEKVPEVEILKNKFFSSEFKAHKWFGKKFKSEDFINPQVVKFNGFRNMRIERTWK